MPGSSLASAFKLAPREAVDYLRGRGQLAESFNWQDVWQEEHAQVFTISRLANIDLMQSLRDGITKSVEGDLSRRDWTKNAEQLLRDAGWWGKNDVVDTATGEVVSTTFNPARLKLIYDTNTRMAYAAGQWQRIERNKATHPYLVYLTMHDEKVRLSHLAWDYVCLPVDDPFWQTHFPPNGWNCRCRVIAITRAQYEYGLFNGHALNKTAPVIDTIPWTNKRTGEVLQVPAGIDPGFAYNPGKIGARAANIAEVEMRKLSAAESEVVAQYRAQSAMLGKVRAYTAKALAEPHARPGVLELAAIPEAFSALADRIDGVTTSGKRFGMDHSTTRHAMLAHGVPEEVLRGQVPITPEDFLLIAQSLDAVTSVKAGDPAVRRDVLRIELELTADGYLYRVVCEVRRAFVVPLTLYKWLVR